jgi:homoaconitate hydratase
MLARRTGWTFACEVRQSLVEVTEGEGGVKRSENVGSLPPNLQELIALGGLEVWVKQEIGNS